MKLEKNIKKEKRVKKHRILSKSLKKISIYISIKSVKRYIQVEVNFDLDEIQTKKYKIKTGKSKQKLFLIWIVDPQYSKPAKSKQ
jgi:hypothetical protein